MTRDRYRKIILALLTINTVACVYYLKTGVEKPTPRHAAEPRWVCDAAQTRLAAVDRALAQCAIDVEEVRYSVNDAEESQPNNCPGPTILRPDLAHRLRALRDSSNTLLRECQALEDNCRNFDPSQGMLAPALDARSHAARLQNLVEGMLSGRVSRNAENLYTAHQELDEVKESYLILDTSVTFLKHESVDAAAQSR